MNDDAAQPQLDWSKLPDGIRFIAGPAERYGWRQFPEHIDDFEQNATDAERAELKALARRLWEERECVDGHAVTDWVGRTDMTAHPEAARVEFLLCLMTEFGYS